MDLLLDTNALLWALAGDDRLPIAQAVNENLVVVTGDSQFVSYGVRIIRC